MIADALEDENNTILVHCVNGKDHSCFVVYAFLRLKYEMNHAAALECVQQRKDTDGRPLFELDQQRSDLVEWVESNVRAATDADSGMQYWQMGQRQAL